MSVRDVIDRWDREDHERRQQDALRLAGFHQRESDEAARRAAGTARAAQQHASSLQQHASSLADDLHSAERRIEELEQELAAGMEDQPGDKEKAAALRALSARWPALEAAERVAEALMVWAAGHSNAVSCDTFGYSFGTGCGACPGCAVNAAYRAYLAARA